jgi:hypothetical protein
MGADNKLIKQDSGKVKIEVETAYAVLKPGGPSTSP